MKQKIYVNGQETSVEDLLSMLTDESGEVDFDTLGAAMNSEILDKAIDSFTERYGMYDLINKYLSLTEKPLEVTI